MLAAGEYLASFAPEFSGAWPFVAGCAALVALFFPIAAEAVPAWMIFAFFGVMMVVHLLWACLVVPETKGRPLEDIA